MVRGQGNMNKVDVNGIWLKVKANSKKLNGCVLHDFSIDMNPDKQMLKRYQCTNCGGEVDHTTKYWYETGLAHGKGNISK